MAEVNTDKGGGKKKGKQKKVSLRVDFTPMVDMNMLLITFFMFCTSLSKPQTMEINMPTNDKDIEEIDKNEVKASDAFTLILGRDNRVYYYEGLPDYTNPNTIKETDYSENGLRKILLSRNAVVTRKIQELKVQRLNDQITEDQFKAQAAEIKKSEKKALVVMIKATDDSTYKNLIDALDEMQICNIAKYAIIDMADGDTFMVLNYETGGALSEAVAKEAAGKK